MSDASGAGASRRGLTAALALLGVGAGLLLLAYGRTWVSVTVSDAGLPALHVDLSGHDLQPEGTAAAIVALAGVAAVVATRRVGRIVSGALLVLVGLGVAVRSVQFATGHASRPGYGDTVASLVAERTGVALPRMAADATAWWALALVGGVLVAAGGAVVLLRGKDWTGLGGRYERTGATAPGSRGARARAARPESAWDQLDRGVDPTAGSDADTAGPGHVDDTDPPGATAGGGTGDTVADPRMGPDPGA